MFGFSLGEVLFLGVLALIVIGPKQLPEVARHVGRFLNDLKRATEGFTDDIKKQAKIDFDFENRPRRRDDPEPPPPAALTTDSSNASSSPAENVVAPHEPAKDDKKS